MRYGFKRGLTTVVSASATVADFEDWYNLIKEASDNYVSSRPSGFVDHLKDLDLKGYKHAAYMFEHADTAEQEAFVNANAITIVTPMAAYDHHQDMLAEKMVGLGYSDDELKDRRTLEEIHLQGEGGDRWDRRTEEEKAKAAAGEKQADQMRKRIGNDVTGSSFDPNPRGAVDDGTFNIRGVTVGQNGAVRVSGTKRAGVLSNPQVSPNQVLEDGVEDQFDESLSKEEILDQLEEALMAANFDSAQVDEWRAAMNANTDADMKTVIATVKATILNKQINQALQPVDGVNSVDEAIEIIEDRLEEIEGLSPERRAQLRDQAYSNLTAPRPKAGDYRFAQNHKLTASSAMRGAGTPIFHVEVNKEGPNKGMFSMQDGIILLEEIGLSMVSGGIFSYELKDDDIRYNADARQALLDAGMVEDIGAHQVPLQSNVGGEKKVTVDDFRKAFAGDGTSAVEGHDSFGRHKLGKSEEEFANEMTAGIVGDKGVTVDCDDLLAKVKWDEIPDDPRILLEKGLGGKDKAPKDAMMGRYAGVQIGDGNYILAVGKDEEVVDSACINIRHLGTVKNPDGSSSFAFSRDQRIAYGFVVVRSKKTLKIYAVA